MYFINVFFFFLHFQFQQQKRHRDTEEEEDEEESVEDTGNLTTRTRPASRSSSQRHESPVSRRVASRVISNPELKDTFLQVSTKNIVLVYIYIYI